MRTVTPGVLGVLLYILNLYSDHRRLLAEGRLFAC